MLTRGGCFSFIYPRSSTRLVASREARIYITDRRSIRSPEVKVGVSIPALYLLLGSSASARRSLAQGATILGRPCPTEWSNYLLIGGSPVSRTITLANPLDGNFNRYNWNRKTGRNADCSSPTWFSVGPWYKSEWFNLSMYFELRAALVMLLN